MNTEQTSKNIFMFQYLSLLNISFNRFCPVEKFGVTVPTLLISWQVWAFKKTKKKRGKFNWIKASAKQLHDVIAIPTWYFPHHDRLAT